MPPPQSGSRAAARLRRAGGRDLLERRGARPADRSGTFDLGYAPNDRQALRQALRAQGFSRRSSWSPPVWSSRADDGDEPYALLPPPADLPDRRRARPRWSASAGASRSARRAPSTSTPPRPSSSTRASCSTICTALPRQPGSAPNEEIVLAEGYMDVVALARAGLEHTVAPLGTAVTERQLGLLYGLSKAPIVCLDGDRAGLGAALRAAERALPLMQGGRSLRFALLPEGEDPDSYLGRHGAAALGRCWRGRRPCRRRCGGWRGRAAVRRRPRLRQPLPAVARPRPPRRRPRPAGGSLWDQFRSPLLRRTLAAAAPPGVWIARPSTGLAPSAWEGVGAARALRPASTRQENSREARLLAPVLHDPGLATSAARTN